MAKGILQQRDFILDYIRRNRAVSRLDIARKFGMHASTVSNIVDELLAEGMVIELERRPASTGAGRPPRFLGLNPDAGRFVGLDLYRRRITAVLTDFSGGVLAERAVSLPEFPERTGVLERMEQVLRQFPVRDDSARGLLGIGIGLPGLVDPEAGIGRSYSPIRDWREVPVGRYFEERFGVPVSVERNSNALALGEVCFGAARGYDHVAAILLRSGISVGEARHRDILRVGRLGAGELGHTIIDPNGPQCWCGARGCLEAHVSGWALRERLRDSVNAHPDWTAGNRLIAGEDFEPSELCRLAAEGDARAESLLREAFRYFAIGVQTVVRLMAPDAVVICGPFHPVAPLIRSEILALLAQSKAHPPRLPEILVSDAGDRMAALGAALLAAARFCNPIHRVPR